MCDTCNSVTSQISLTVAFSTTCFGLMFFSSHDLSVVACINKSTFLAVLAEFELFTIVKTLWTVIP